jgi:serine/threonine protein kinase
MPPMPFRCIRCQSPLDKSFKACPHCGEPVTDFLRRYLEEPIDGKYEILERLGTGGMGDVYKVRHTYLGTLRVVKVIRAQIAERSEAHERFLREARMATRIQHPHVATVHDFSALPDGSHYMVSEYIEGENLAQRIRAAGTLPPRYAVELAIQALQGLEAIHRAGITHRDISPENLMITRESGGHEHLKIIDLGVAKSEDIDSGTRTGMFVGKLRYAPPEQLGFMEEGERIDGRADLYSMAVVLYEMLAGRAPYEATSPHQYIAIHSRDTQFRPLELPRNMPGGEALQAVIAKALERDRRKRFATAREFAAALEEVARSLPDPGAMRTVELPFDADATIRAASLSSDTLQRATIRSELQAELLKTPPPAAPVVPPALPPPTIQQPPATPTVIEPYPQRRSKAGLIALIAMVVVLGGAAAYYFYGMSKATPVVTASATPPPLAAPATTTSPASQTALDVVVPPLSGTDTVTTASSSTTTRPAAPDPQRAEIPATTSTPSSAPANATLAPVEEPRSSEPAGSAHTFIDGGDSDRNDEALQELRQQLSGVTSITIRSNDPQMGRQIAERVGSHMTVTEGAGVVINFNGTLTRLGMGRKRRAAQASVVKNGHTIFRYDLPSVDYRVGDNPAEAFLRAIEDALP